MKSLEEVRALVVGQCPVLPPVRIATAAALGLVLAEPVVAGEAVPPFDNTAMDGFAVRAADTVGASGEQPVELAVVGTLPAGAAPDRPVGPGEAIRIMTGAPMPPGADAVVMVERTSTVAPSTGGSDGRERVRIEVEVPPGNHVRRAGDDVRPGDPVLAPGTVLGPAQVGVLASVGVTEVRAHPRARVGVLSTGDELVQDGAPLRPGQIRDSNRPALLALVAEAGAEPIDLGCAPDDEDTIAAAIDAALATCDALVTSGGVSMGDYDYVRAVLERRRGALAWMQVAIKPAKPLAFGTLPAPTGERSGIAVPAADSVPEARREVPVFGLPGNPVSSMVSFELFARPALRRMMGWPDAALDRPRIRAVADQALARRPDGKVHLVRVQATFGPNGRLHVRSAGGQGSHQLAAMAAADGLALVPDGAGVAAGDDVDVLLFGQPGSTLVR